MQDYAESQEFLPALGLFISRRSLSLQLEVNEIPRLLEYKYFSMRRELTNKTRLIEIFKYMYVYKMSSKLKIF